MALRTTGQRQQFLNCRFVGYQDTLYTHSGSQYFKNCYVQGNTDYVFGGATAVLDNCEVRNVEGGSATAAPNTDIGAPYGIVFLGGKFTAASGVQGELGRAGPALGRGRRSRRICTRRSARTSPPPASWRCSGNQPENARFHEYESTGSGANAVRALALSAQRERSRELHASRSPRRLDAELQPVRPWARGAMPPPAPFLGRTVHAPRAAGGQSTRLARIGTSVVLSMVRSPSLQVPAMDLPSLLLPTILPGAIDVVVCAPTT